MKHLVLCAILVTACGSVKAQGTYEGLTGYSAASPTVANISATGGWYFAPAADINVSALGCFEYIVSSQGAVSVGLWDSSGVLLASNLVTASSSLINETRYENLANLIPLTAAHVYYLGVYASAGYGVRLIGFNEGESFTTSPAIVHSSVGYGLGTGGFGFPTAGSDSQGLIMLAPNFRYGVVPEPSAVALFGLALLSLVGVRLGRRQ